LADTDGDGVADYLDDKEQSSEIMSVLLGGKKSAIETTLGLKLKLGFTGQNAVNKDMLVSVDDIINYGQALSSDGSIPTNTTDNFDNKGGLFDFILSDLPIPGFSAPIVLPQLTAIPANAVYRKYNQSTGWKDFEITIDDNNKIYSSLGSIGVCPSPEDASYQLGLIEGYYCVKLLIQDGGPNDSDGLANGEVVDPGGVAVYNPTVCTQEYLPVCGVDNTTYSNSCQVDAAGISIAHEGECMTIPTKPEEVVTEFVEGNAQHTAYFLLQISKAMTIDSSVDFTTMDGTALAGEDYTVTSGSATIKAGETSMVIPVVIIADSVAEGNETFKLVITNPDGAIFPLGTTQITATRTIIDDD